MSKRREGNPFVQATESQTGPLEGWVDNRLETTGQDNIQYFALLSEMKSRHFLNHQIVSMLGFSSDEWGDPGFWFRQLHSEDCERVLLEIGRNLSHGRRFQSEYRLLARDGRVVWVRDEGVIRRDRAARHCFIEGEISYVTALEETEPPPPEGGAPFPGTRIQGEPGREKAFKTDSPRMQETRINFPPRDDGDLPRGTETVLLVEDEPALRDLMARVLRELGYTVWEAANGDEALQRIRENVHLRVHILLSDVIMPKMGAMVLVEQVKAQWPDCRALFVSGYDKNTLVQHGVYESGILVLKKPFSLELLARKLREVLDGKQGWNTGRPAEILSV